jgi:hypothetical protein
MPTKTQTPPEKAFRRMRIDTVRKILGDEFMPPEQERKTANRPGSKHSVLVMKSFLESVNEHWDAHHSEHGFGPLSFDDVESIFVIIAGHTTRHATSVANLVIEAANVETPDNHFFERIAKKCEIAREAGYWRDDFEVVIPFCKVGPKSRSMDVGLMALHCQVMAGNLKCLDIDRNIFGPTSPKDPHQAVTDVIMKLGAPTGDRSAIGAERAGQLLSASHTPRTYDAGAGYYGDDDRD